MNPTVDSPPSLDSQDVGSLSLTRATRTLAVYATAEELQNISLL